MLLKNKLKKLLADYDYVLADNAGNDQLQECLGYILEYELMLELNFMKAERAEEEKKRLAKCSVVEYKSIKRIGE